MSFGSRRRTLTSVGDALRGIARHQAAGTLTIEIEEEPEMDEHARIQTVDPALDPDDTESVTDLGDAAQGKADADFTTSDTDF